MALARDAVMPMDCILLRGYIALGNECDEYMKKALEFHSFAIYKFVG